MGKFVYGSHAPVEFDDRLLTHLQLVMGAKLRRNEAFFFSWRDESESGGGRSSVWVHPSIEVGFKFHGSRSPAVNRAWIDELMASANSSGGLRITPEPKELPHENVIDQSDHT